MNQLQALTVRQPWAECIALGEKLIENRSWPTKYRGLIAIHAAKSDANSAFDDERVQRLLNGRTGHDCWDRGIVTDQPWQIRGAVIAVAQLVDCHPVSKPDECCQPWGDPERWHWVLDDVRRLARPIPASGRLGLFPLPELLAATVRDQIEVVR